jgi:hypothetical protein
MVCMTPASSFFFFFFWGGLEIVDRAHDSLQMELSVSHRCDTRTLILYQFLIRLLRRGQSDAEGGNPSGGICGGRRVTCS